MLSDISDSVIILLSLTQCALRFSDLRLAGSTGEIVPCPQLNKLGGLEGFATGRSSSLYDSSNPSQYASTSHFKLEDIPSPGNARKRTFMPDPQDTK
ncbi:hypothetical protein V5O48_019601, partial [Marasmius crinis-equi]